MNPLLQNAVLNNAQWCDAVCRLNKAPGTFLKDYWLNLKQVPEFYPNIITISPIAQKSRSVDELYSLINTNKGSLSIKDSFAELDLKDQKFKKIFEGEWIGYEPTRIDGVMTRWQRIHFPKRFDKWVENWKTQYKTNFSPFPAQILKNEDIWICGEYSEERFVKGAILYIKDNTIGISNIFSSEPITHAFWEELIGFIGVQFPGAQVVGYENGDRYQASIRAGFTPLGELVVWSR